MSEEKINVKSLTVSKAVDLFLEGKISKSDMKDAFDKSSLFRVNSKRLEKILDAQKKDSTMFPKSLRIKSSDIIHEYGRTLSAGELMNLASKGYVSEEDVLKALKKNTVMTILASVDERDNTAPKKEDTKTKDDEKPDEMVVTPDNILKKDDVKKFFSPDRLLKMFFAHKMTREFAEAYEEAFKDDYEHNQAKSKELIKELKDIFQDNLQALYIVVIRLHFKGMILVDDVEEMIKGEFFREKIYDPSDEYDVLDKDGNVIYRYKRIKSGNDVEQEDVSDITYIEIDSDTEDSELDDVRDEAHYPVLEPITQDEVIDEYNDSNIDITTLKCFFTMSELQELYKQKRVNVQVFTLVEPEKRKGEILRAYQNGYMHLEGIMELFFYYDGITAKELKSIIKEIPRKVAIVRFITVDTGFEKIYELYKNKLIDFNILCQLRDQGYISIEKFEEIRGCVNKEEFYDSIKSQTFYTYKQKEPGVTAIVESQPDNADHLETDEAVEGSLDYTSNKTDLEPNELLDRLNEALQHGRVQDDDIPETTIQVDNDLEILNEDNSDKKSLIEISDSERVLLAKVLGVSEEEIRNISIISSKDKSGLPTVLDGYQIISIQADGLVIFGKFDFTSPIYVMTYEEASYYLQSRDDVDVHYIYDDLMYTKRLEGNSQVCVVEHDENMGRNIIEAVCKLSEVARERYSRENQYMEEVRSYIRVIDEKYAEMIIELNNNV